MSEALKIAILADSLALPRPPEAGDIPYEATYPFLLDQDLRQALPRHCPVIIERGQRFRTIAKVLDDWTEIVSYRKPQIVVIHVGIVDCAPRVFSSSQRAWVGKLPGWLQWRVLALVKKYRAWIIARRPRLAYTPLPEFAAAIDDAVSRCRQDGVRRLLLVNILEPSAAVEERSPGYTKAVEAYNQVLARLNGDPMVEVVDFNGILEAHGGVAALTVDGMHPNREGNRLLANKLFRHILDIEEKEHHHG